MPGLKSIQILLVEDDLGDEGLLREALIEIEDDRMWRNWRSSELTHADCLSDALDFLGQQRFDVILLNLSLPDTPSLLDAFLETQARAGDTPILILADNEDEDLAALLIREGAQDVIFKGAIECAPLSRAMLYAIARTNRMSAREKGVFRDDMTGLYNRAAFLEIAGHHLRLARAARRPTQLVVLDLAENGALVREERDLLIIRAGCLAQGLFDERALIGRIGEQTIGVLASGATSHTAKRRMAEFRADLRSDSESFPKKIATCAVEASPFGDESAAELLDNAEQMLRGGAVDKTAMLAD